LRPTNQNYVIVSCFPYACYETHIFHNSSM
jgi:hypothetical protein